MPSKYDLDNLENIEDFRINPHAWLKTLLAIAGDKDRKAEVVQVIAEKTGFTTDKVEVIMATTISVLMNDTRSN
jgi:hypothetical protein